MYICYEHYERFEYRYEYVHFNISISGYGTSIGYAVFPFGIFSESVSKLHIGYSFVDRFLNIFPIYIYTLAVKSIGTTSKIFIFVLKVLFFVKKVDHHVGFIYYTKYKTFSATLNTNYI